MAEEVKEMSELRYITIELMKIATRRKVPFRRVAEEFLENVMTLHDMISSYSERIEIRRRR